MKGMIEGTIYAPPDCIAEIETVGAVMGRDTTDLWDMARCSFGTSVQFWAWFPRRELAALLEW